VWSAENCASWRSGQTHRCKYVAHLVSGLPISQADRQYVLVSELWRVSKAMVVSALSATSRIMTNRDSGIMPSATDVLDREAWHGGFYELAIEVGERDDNRLQAAPDALWDAAAIDGPYEVLWTLTPRSRPIPRTVASLNAGHHLRGLVTLPDERACICCVIAVREDPGAVDWLDFCLPIGALGVTDPRIGGFPFGDEGGPSSLAWRQPIDDWLASLGSAVYMAAPFRLGLIGFEASGSTDASEVGGQPPSERYVGYLLPDGPTYHPANR
jgi:hypothetical protein